MRFFYSQIDDELIRRLAAMKDLMALFNYILLQVSGDVDKAFKVMKKLQEMGYIPSDWDLDEFKRQLQDKKMIRHTGHRSRLTARGEQQLREDAFDQIFQNLRNSGPGGHIINTGGGDSEEILPEKRPYGFGDDIKNLDLTGSLLNSINRTGSLGINLDENDLEVYETSRTTSAATVILIDISHSMILYGEDRITPAKQVALAFSEMIKKKYPRDSLNIVTFGDEAREITLKDIPYLSVGPFHTNTKEGLQMARNILLRRKNSNKQIFMITDGKPSVVRRRNGSLYKNPVGLDPIIVNRTLDEAVACRKKRIIITTFMITDDPYLKNFIMKLTELNRGRAYFSSPQNLGSYVLMDFMNNRKKNG